VLPTKKFPELKLMINGDQKAGQHTLSSDDELQLNVSVTVLTTLLVPTHKKDQQLTLRYEQF
jgi:hypothetical protein